LFVVVVVVLVVSAASFLTAVTFIVCIEEEEVDQVCLFVCFGLDFVRLLLLLFVVDGVAV
jgi:hypothetical protein